jgi:hypothetical protein
MVAVSLIPAARRVHVAEPISSTSVPGYSGQGLISILSEIATNFSIIHTT